MDKIEIIKEVRHQTGCSLIDAKQSVDEANGDKEKALNLARQKMALQKDAAPVNGQGIGRRLRTQMAIQSLPGLVGRIFILKEEVKTCCISKEKGPCAIVSIICDDGGIIGAPVAWNHLRSLHQHLDMILCFAMTKE